MVEHERTMASLHKLFEKHGLLVKLDKGRHVFLEGEAAEDVFFIVSGKIMISKETESGKELTLRICGDYDIIGEGSLFCNLVFHSLSAKAVEPTTLFSINRKSLELLLSQDPALLIECMKWLQDQNIKYQTKLRDLLLHGKKGALFSTLIRMTNTFGVKQDDGSILIDYSLTNGELANFCATSREVINRMLNELKKIGVVSFEKGYITVHDLEILKAEIECENCPIHICRID